MSLINFEPTDIATFTELHFALRHKKSLNSTTELEITGTHPVCGGKCVISKRNDGDNDSAYLIKKPHRKCDPVECLDVLKHECTGGGSKPLPQALLDCNR